MIQPSNLDVVQTPPADQRIHEEVNISRDLPLDMGEAVDELSMLHLNAFGILTGEIHRFAENLQTIVTRPVAPVQQLTTGAS